MINFSVAKYKKFRRITMKGRQVKSHRCEGSNWDLVDEVSHNRDGYKLLEGYSMIRGEKCLN